MEFWIKQGVLQIQLPVPPSEFSIKAGSDHQKVNVYKTGDLLLAGNRTLDTISFSSFFPNPISKKAYQCPYDKPWRYVEKIKTMMDNKKPVQLLITGTGINMECLIDSFEYGAGKGLDVNFSITFTQYRKVKLPTLDSESSGGEEARPTPPVVPPANNRTHTIASGESLWSIAKKYYNDGSKWTKIWDANKPMRSGNANVIYKGEVVKIP